MTTMLGKNKNPVSRMLNSLAPNFSYGRALTQLFLHEPERRTTLTFTNVASLYAPRGASGCQFEVSLYGETGELVAATDVVVPAYGSASVHLADLIPGTLPRHGLAVARLRNAPRFHMGARHLGAIAPFFYALYHAPDMGSLALVHNQSGIESDVHSDSHWHSNLLVPTKGLRALEAWQINPTPVSAPSTLQLWRGEELLDERPTTLAPMASRQERFESRLFEAREQPVHIAVKGMTAANAKPLLFHHHAAGGFSASHA